MKIVCLGDSITCDLEPPSYVIYWQELCNQKWGQGKVTIINAGINGDTAGAGYLRLEQDVIAHKPDLVTIMFGHNEVHGGYTPQDLYRYLDKIVAQLLEASTPKIWLLTPNLIADKNMVEQYSDFLLSIDKLGQERHLPLVDFWTLMKPLNLNEIYTNQFDYAGLTCQDYLHPNEIGHRFMAKVLFDQLEKDIENFVNNLGINSRIRNRK